MLTSLIDSEDRAAVYAAKTTTAICDRSHWGRIEVTGEDRLRFLHNQSTNNFQSLQPGSGCDTVMVTSTARTIDLVTGYVLEDRVLLLVSPNRREFLLSWLDRYIFFADQVTLTDITDQTATFTLLGPESDTLISKLGAASLLSQPDGHHISINGIIFAVGTGLAIPGYTLILPRAEKQQIWQQLLDWGAVKLSDRHWEMLRISQGRPAPDAELTDDYNPLEVGLWQTVSFNKGCYIGQETIARLNTYKGVKQHLWGIKLKSCAQPGTIITILEEKVGKLTSYIETPEGHFGLGYIRAKAGGVGLTVEVGETQGEIVPVPFVSWDYPQ
ncbi:folate-binding protein [Cylindrospermopsis raciborskii]|uniref:CAF17-like 4Fe-4S cluster assembly/insertion protein YgfZ n=1 Tax=Cylindrospermopsis raciborskii TaxID=77022 RepID=UPI0022BB7DC7|nr:folate-binding protein [Cylindrospermopsis raciborskii]MCZ2207458.1 folate-binding protein [Cylindrospermopsis raciborskii PAMP2011]